MTDFVAPLVGAWIEIQLCVKLIFHAVVAPLVGAWIEIDTLGEGEGGGWVGPLGGAGVVILSNLYVAPLVGAWIEIVGRKTEKIFRKSSLPSWERGLK